MSRRRPRMLLAVVAILGALLLLPGCRAQDADPVGSPNTLTSAELVEEPASHDGVTIEFTGEVIGEAMVRGEYAWLHLNDDAYYLMNTEEGAALGGYNAGMPVWVPAAEAGKITTFGDHRHAGDIVVVRGVFNAACAEHGGDMDIHATSLEVLAVGRDATDPVSPVKLAWAIGLSLLAGALYVLQRNWGTWSAGGAQDR